MKNPTREQLEPLILSSAKIWGWVDNGCAIVEEPVRTEYLKLVRDCIDLNMPFPFFQNVQEIGKLIYDDLGAGGFRRRPYLPLEDASSVIVQVNNWTYGGTVLRYGKHYAIIEGMGGGENRTHRSSITEVETEKGTLTRHAD